MSQTEERPVTVDVEIDDGQTVIEVTNDRDAAVVVESESGQRIYLPPEDFDRPAGGRRQGSYQSGGGPGEEGDTPATGQGTDHADSPYESPSSSDSPYQSADSDDSAYQRADGRVDSEGLHSTADGFKIVHPEPVSDFRLLR
ncbi:MAG: hypothetical protein ABEI99_13200 [Halobaculum sp.]